MKWVERRYIKVVSKISEFDDKSGMDGAAFFLLWILQQVEWKNIFCKWWFFKNCICSLGPLSILFCQCPVVLGIYKGWSGAGMDGMGSSIFSPQGVSQQGGRPSLIYVLHLSFWKKKFCSLLPKNFNPSWPSLANWTLEWAQTSDVISVSPTRRSHFCLHLLISFLGSARFLPDSINLSKGGKKGSRPRGWDGLKRRKSGNVTKFRARG